jgi:hypothetical protein
MFAAGAATDLIFLSLSNWLGRGGPTALALSSWR